MACSKTLTCFKNLKLNEKKRCKKQLHCKKKIDILCHSAVLRPLYPLYGMHKVGTAAPTATTDGTNENRYYTNEVRHSMRGGTGVEMGCKPACKVTAMVGGLITAITVHVTELKKIKGKF